MSSGFIALDWGTSSFRAYLLNRDGAIQETIAAPHGILAVKDAAFDETLESSHRPLGQGVAGHGVWHDYQPSGLG